jgi:hypothetical protein
MGRKQIFSQEIDHVLCSLKKGEVMSQFGIQVKLCAEKISSDSSIQAQHPGEFMRRKWRSYSLFDRFPFITISPSTDQYGGLPYMGRLYL